MGDSQSRLITILLLFGITVVFVSPMVNLDPTALRASRAAQVLISTLASAAFLFSSFLIASGRSRIALSGKTAAQFPGDLLALTCSLLC